VHITFAAERLDVLLSHPPVWMPNHLCEHWLHLVLQAPRQGRDDDRRRNDVHRLQHDLCSRRRICGEWRKERNDGENTGHYVEKSFARSGSFHQQQKQEPDYPAEEA
jgi:hypothetical protein